MNKSSKHVTTYCNITWHFKLFIDRIKGVKRDNLFKFKLYYVCIISIEIKFNDIPM